MNEYILVRQSQRQFYKNVALYCQSAEGSYVLYKKAGDLMDKSRFDEVKDTNLFVAMSDRDLAVREIQKVLNFNLARSVASKGVNTVKAILCEIVDEALANPGPSQDSLPETIEIIFSGYSRNSELLESLSRVSGSSRLIVNHSVNVMALSIVYCISHRLSEMATKRIGLGALLHDIGTSEVDRTLIETEQRLTDEEFNVYKTHCRQGHDLISKNTTFDSSIARVALEHHERIDGSGYPDGATEISFESQVVGLIDSFEPLINREKAFRKVKKAFDALQLIKDEVIGGRYSKDLFRQFCSCLTR
ncbi:MAG: HD domain-containing phosphohydrolase [Pseudomonadota bacterium]